MNRKKNPLYAALIVILILSACGNKGGEAPTAMETAAPDILFTELPETTAAVEENPPSKDSIAALFPPKTETILVEGFEEKVPYTSFGEMPDSVKAGFAMYYDSGSYTVMEEHGVYYIRPIWAADDSTIPACEMIIEHSDFQRDALCRELYDKMAASWETVHDISRWAAAECLVFSAVGGSNWDSPVEIHYFFHDGFAGSYHITAKYFLEASEGHGMRFPAMASSFTLVTPEMIKAAETGQTEPAPPLQVEPATIDGYALTPDGDSVPVQITIGVERVVQGEEAYRELLNQNAACPAPDDGQEYIIVTVNVTYEGGELETLNFYKNYPASWEAARIHFNIPNRASNSTDVTAYLTNSIWGQDPMEGRILARGERVSGDVAFLVETGNTQPLYFVGYGEAVQFQIH